MDSPRLVLASASPRRRALLAAMGLDFATRHSGIDESSIEADSPQSLAIKTAAAKAEAVAVDLDVAEPSLVIAADTVVVLSNRVFGKPVNREHAADMLRKLSGRAHEVITGLIFREHPCSRASVASSEKRPEIWLGSERTLVSFHALSESQIWKYVDSGEADDKAGAYGLQGFAGTFIAAVEGELSNVIGLCLGKFRLGMIEMAGFDPMEGRTEREILRAAFSDLPRELEILLKK